MTNAIVLGARSGSGNIGDGIANVLHELCWNVITDDCQTWDNEYQVPGLQSSQWTTANALIVTLGRTGMDPFLETDNTEIEEVIRGSLILPLQCVLQYVKYRQDRGGNVILIGSYAHRHPFSTGTAYCAAKAGIEQAGKTLAWELTDKNYQVNVIHPYHVIGTPMWEKVQEGVMENKNMTREEADAYAYKDTKMELASPRTLGHIVHSICTEPGFAWTSGSSIEVFGGTR